MCTDSPIRNIIHNKDFPFFTKLLILIVQQNLILIKNIVPKRNLSYMPCGFFLLFLYFLLPHCILFHFYFETKTKKKKEKERKKEIFLIIFA